VEIPPHVIRNALVDLLGKNPLVVMLCWRPSRMPCSRACTCIALTALSLCAVCVFCVVRSDVRNHPVMIHCNKGKVR
jgi:hypothetical protein